jgi:hypothetical protein
MESSSTLSSSWFHACHFILLALLLVAVQPPLALVSGFVPPSASSPRLWNVQQQKYYCASCSALRLLPRPPPFAVDSRTPPLLLSAWGINKKNPYSSSHGNVQTSNSKSSTTSVSSSDGDNNSSGSSTDGVCTIQILMSDTGKFLLFQNMMSAIASPFFSSHVLFLDLQQLQLQHRRWTSGIGQCLARCTGRVTSQPVCRGYCGHFHRLWSILAVQ